MCTGVCLMNRNWLCKGERWEEEIGVQKNGWLEWWLNGVSDNEFWVWYNWDILMFQWQTEWDGNVRCVGSRWCKRWCLLWNVWCLWNLKWNGGAEISHQHHVTRWCLYGIGKVLSKVMTTRLVLVLNWRRCDQKDDWINGYLFNTNHLPPLPPIDKSLFRIVN